MLRPPKCAFIIVLFAATVFDAVAPPAGNAASPTMLDQARELHRVGKLEPAAVAYRAVLAEGDLDEASLAIAANNLCVVLDALGDLVAAEAACGEALGLRLKLGDRLRLARTLNNLGLVLQHSGRYAEAEERFSEALEINRDLDDPFAQAINLANLGAVATQAGRFQQALERQREVLELAREHRDQPWAGEQSRIAQINRGVVLERLGAYREALETFRGLLAAGPDVRPEQKASILVNSGVIYRNLGDPVQAIARFEEAAAIYRELGDRAGRAHADLNIGIARHLNLNDVAGAEADYRRALALVEESGDRGLEIDILCFLGRLLLSSDRVAEASTCFEAALARARDSGSVEGEWVALAGLGETARARGDLVAALDHFEDAILRIEKGRAEVARPEHRASFLADHRTVYSGAVETLAELDDGENGALAARALEVAQRAKSRDLLDALELRQAMEPLDEKEIARRLDKSILIEYFVTGTDLFMWWTEAGFLRLARLGDPRPILEAVGEVHQALSNGEEPAGELVDRLSDTLFGSLNNSPGLSGSATASRGIADVWIAPDRALHYLPFEILSLPSPVSPPTDRSKRRLLTRARVSYLPSAWALPTTPVLRRSEQFEVGFLGFGAIDYSRQSERAPAIARLALAPLPAARRELESVARHLDGPIEILLGDNATEAAFRAHAGQSVAVMHFATHTALTERRGEESAILLTPEGGDDGLLSPSEIAESRVDSALVVLASCTTALSAERDGRALTTLTGAFLAAGAESVLATLWPVADQPTAVFMEQFYYQLSRGLAPDEALRKTKMRFLQDDRWQSPALWSGYVLVGSGSAVLQRRMPWLWLGALALTVALVALGWRARASRA